MKLFGSSATTVALIDVRSSSIAAGYAVVKRGVPVALPYAVRLPLDPHATEPLEDAFDRTLELVLRDLVTKGAPLLRKATGSGKTDRALVSFTSPWQRSNVFSHHVEPGRPFVFSQQTLADVAAQAPAVPEGWTRANETVLATLLNGYEVENPNNKRVNSADLFMLSTSLESIMMGRVAAAIRKHLHQHHIDFDAFLPDVFEVMRDLYPHQRDYLVIDVGNAAVDMLLAKHGFLVSANNISHGIGDISRAARGAGVSSPAVPTDADALEAGKEIGLAEAEAAWVHEITEALGAVVRQEPLPRSVFLFAEEGVRDYVAKLLDTTGMRQLWLTEESLSFMPMLPGQFAPFFAAGCSPAADAPLSVLALSAQVRYA